MSKKKDKFEYRYVPVTYNKYEHRYYIEYSKRYWFGFFSKWKKIYAIGSLMPLIVEGYESTVAIIKSFYDNQDFDPTKIQRHQPLVK